MIDLEAVAQARLALGRQLASYRKRAGLSQGQLAPLLHYGRSSIANVETGRQDVHKLFWERADQILHADGALICAYQELQALLRRRRREAEQALEAERDQRYRDTDHPFDTGAETPDPAYPQAPVTTRHAVPVFAPLDTPAEPWTRLAHALAHPQRIDDATIAHLQWHTGELYRREEQCCAQGLAGDVKSHLTRLKRLLTGAPETHRQRLRSLYGETLALAGWLAWNANTGRTADSCYRQAERVARRISDGALLACVLTYRSHLAESRGDSKTAHQLVVEAQRHAGTRHHGATRAWTTAREAELAATLGDASAAWHALDRATIAYDYAHPHHERPWTATLTPGRLGTMAVTTYARLNRPDLDSIADLVLTTLTATETRYRAITLTHLATTNIRNHHYDTAAHHANQALDLTTTRPHRTITQHLNALHHSIKEKTHIPALAKLNNRLDARLRP